MGLKSSIERFDLPYLEKVIKCLSGKICLSKSIDINLHTQRAYTIPICLLTLTLQSNYQSLSSSKLLGKRKQTPRLSNLLLSSRIYESIIKI